MPTKVWINGQLIDKNDAKISVFDHGLLFGDGLCTGTRIYGGRPFRLAEHLSGLGDCARTIDLALPLSPEQLANAVGEAIAANGRTEGYVRVIVTRGVGTLGLDPRKCDPSVIIVAEDLIPYPREVYSAGLQVVTAAVLPRYPGPPGTLSQIANVFAKGHALWAGCLEALVLDHRGEVSGFTDGSIFLVNDGAIATPAPDHGDWNPVIRAFVLELAGELGIPANPVRPLTRDDVAAADEVFLASAAAEIIAVVKLDDQPIGSGVEGPITRQLREHYREAARRPSG